QYLILAQRLLAMPAQRVHAHQRAVRLFVGGVAFDQAFETCLRTLVASLRLVQRSQREQQRMIFGAQRLTAALDLVVVAVFRQQVAAVQVERGLVGLGGLVTACAFD